MRCKTILFLHSVFGFFFGFCLLSWLCSWCVFVPSFATKYLLFWRGKAHFFLAQQQRTMSAHFQESGMSNTRKCEVKKCEELTKFRGSRTLSFLHLKRLTLEFTYRWTFFLGLTAECFFCFVFCPGVGGPNGCLRLSHRPSQAPAIFDRSHSVCESFNSPSFPAPTDPFFHVLRWRCWKGSGG